MQRYGLGSAERQTANCPAHLTGVLAPREPSWNDAIHESSQSPIRPNPSIGINCHGKPSFSPTLPTGLSPWSAAPAEHPQITKRTQLQFLETPPLQHLPRLSAPGRRKTNPFQQLARGGIRSRSIKANQGQSMRLPAHVYPPPSSSSQS